MRLPADMRGRKEWAVPQRQFGMPGKKAVRTEQTDEARPKQEQPEMDQSAPGRQADEALIQNSRGRTVCRTGNQNPLPGSSGLHL